MYSNMTDYGRFQPAVFVYWRGLVICRTAFKDFVVFYFYETFRECVSHQALLAIGNDLGWSFVDQLKYESGH
jgi:hypothetical protein